MGDLNLDYSSDQIRRKYKTKQFETKFNLNQFIKTHTRITETTSTTLDSAYSSSPHMTAGTLNYNISDHLPIYLVRKKQRNKIVKINVQGRSYLQYNRAEFQRLLSESNWDTFDHVDEPNQLWCELENNIRTSLDRMCPVRNLTVPKHKPDWLTADIVQLMRKRDKVYQNARKNNDPVIWRKARFLRNRVESLINQYKCNKIQNELQQNAQHPKKFWNNIRTILPNDKGQEVHKLVDEDTGESHEGENLAVHINSFFANIGPKLALDITTKNRLTPTTTFCAPMNDDADGVTNDVIMANEIREVLKLVDVNKSSAIENIRSNVIIDACLGEIERFVKLYNGSLTHCTFPDKWKYSTVIPLSKVSNPKNSV